MQDGVDDRNSTMVPMMSSPDAPRIGRRHTLPPPWLLRDSRVGDRSVRARERLIATLMAMARPFEPRFTCSRMAATLCSREERAMKNIGVLVLAALLIFVTVTPAAAQYPGGYVNPVEAILLFPFAVAATVVGGVAAVLTAPFAYPYAPYPAAYRYPYPYSYPYAYATPAAVYATAPAPARSYWYYCESARTYYPYISTCPEGWMPVVPSISARGAGRVASPNDGD